MFEEADRQRNLLDVKRALNFNFEVINDSISRSQPAVLNLPEKRVNLHLNIQILAHLRICCANGATNRLGRTVRLEIQERGAEFRIRNSIDSLVRRGASSTTGPELPCGSPSVNVVAKVQLVTSSLRVVDLQSVSHTICRRTTNIQTFCSIFKC